jgi:alkylresorcinol/alkylpyrone synthase
VIGSRTIGSQRPEVVSVASSLPAPVAQDDVAAFVSARHPELRDARALAVFANTGIERRHLVQPLPWYDEPHPAGERFALACSAALEHGSAAAASALGRAGVDASEIDNLVFVSTTVLRSPGLDASLVPALGLRPDVRRVPLFGFASLGGAAGLALAADLVSAGEGPTLVVCVEMNSLTYVPGRTDMESVITRALFSDGAAAAVLRPGGDGDEHLRVVGHHSTLVPDSLGMMGFDATDDGLRWRLAPDVADVALEETRPSVTDALASVGWDPAHLDHVLIHPGGTKVLDAVEAALELPPGALDWSREVMRAHGNVSSVTVLLVLERFVALGPPPGRVLLTAMGPGFGYEHVMLER